MNQDVFDSKLEGAVTGVSKALEQLAKLIEGKPGLMDSARFAKTFLYLTARVEQTKHRATVARSAPSEFSLAAELSDTAHDLAALGAAVFHQPAPPRPPRPAVDRSIGGRLVGSQHESAPDAGVDFLDDDEE